MLQQIVIFQEKPIDPHRHGKLRKTLIDSGGPRKLSKHRKTQIYLISAIIFLTLILSKKNKILTVYLTVSPDGLHAAYRANRCRWTKH